MFNSIKKNLVTIHREKKNGFNKDFELQTILFNLEGAIIIFKETSIRFINLISEDIFSKAVPNFQDKLANNQYSHDK